MQDYPDCEWCGEPIKTARSIIETDGKPITITVGLTALDTYRFHRPCWKEYRRSDGFDQTT